METRNEKRLGTEISGQFEGLRGESGEIRAKRKGVRVFVNKNEHTVELIRWPFETT